MADIAPSSYCAHALDHPYHGPYHDNEYGFPIRDDRRLFERLCLEMNQAGLSWLTILKKRDGLRRAYDDFEPGIVAAYGDEDRNRLLSDPGVIRNRLKVDAAIHNAGCILRMRDQHGSFADWLDAHQLMEDGEGGRPRTKSDWVKLFKKTFRFTGGEITGEFLISTGYLPGAHDPGCPVFGRIARLDPPWMRRGLSL